MDKEMKGLISKSVAFEITNNLLHELGGNVKKNRPDAIKDKDWLALNTMLIHTQRDLKTLIDKTLQNDEGGTYYMAMLTVIHDEIVKTAQMIEGCFGVKTGWFPPHTIEKGKTGDKSGDYFYNKLRREVEEYMNEQKKEGGDDGLLRNQK